jgi:glycosyltransferase involved in cell wall biosynthesis
VRTICFCNSNIPWGGGEKWHLEAALALSGRGWRVLFLCHPESEILKRLAGAPAIQTLPFACGRLSFLNPMKRLHLTRLFRREGVDSVIMNLPSDVKVAAPAARSAGVKHIVYRRGSALPVRDSRLNRRLYGKVITQLIVNSEATRALVLRNNPSLIPPERISLLPNGLDVAAFDESLRTACADPLPAHAAQPALAQDGKQCRAPSACRPGRHDGCGAPSAASGRAESLRAKTGGRPFLLGNAGRLTRQKGQHLLLHLCRRLLDAGLDCAVLIAGTGELEKELKTLAARLELGDRARFLGFMETLAPFWRNIDLFVLSSLWEGFGSVLIEAMLARKPVFAFAVSNIPELVFEDGPGINGNGRLFPLPEEELPHCPYISLKTGKPALAEKSPPELTGQILEGAGSAAAQLAGRAGTSAAPYASLDAMAQAVLDLAAHPEAGARMGEAGRCFALRFSQDACMDRLEELLS